MMYTGAFGAAENQRLVKWLNDTGLADDYVNSIDWATLDWRKHTKAEADRIQDYFGRLFATMTKQELLAEAIRRRIMIQPVSSARDLVNHVHLQARDYWQYLDYPSLGVKLRYPVRFCLNSETPGRNWRRAPMIGEHNQEIYAKELNYSISEIIAMKEAGII